jgi:uncharacterized integral membrane protein
MARSSQESEQPSGGLAELVTARRVLVAVLVVVFAVWSFANSQEVTVDLLVQEAEMRLFVALLLAGAVGVAVGYLLARRRSD